MAEPAAVDNFPDQPNQPEDIDFPIREFGKSRITYYSFQCSWFKLWKWLHYDVKRDESFCFWCLKYIHLSDNIIKVKYLNKCLVTKGYRNWKNATTQYRNHEKSELHLLASRIFVKDIEDGQQAEECDIVQETAEISETEADLTEDNSEWMTENTVEQAPAILEEILDNKTTLIEDNDEENDETINIDSTDEEALVIDFMEKSGDIEQTSPNEILIGENELVEDETYLVHNNVEIEQLDIYPAGHIPQLEFSANNAIKILAVGDPGCGKKSLLKSYMSTENQIYSQAIHRFCVDDAHAYILVNTISGSEDHTKASVYKSADVVLFVFSLDSLSTLKNIHKKWGPEVHHYNAQVSSVLVGTKWDVVKGYEFPDPDSVADDAIETVSKAINAYDHVKCSAKYGNRVDEVIYLAIMAFYNNYQRQ